jgi:uroporphyrinogen decarboxylase
MKEMTSRERVRKTLNHEEPDRVPIDIGGPVCNLQEKAYINLANYLNMDVTIDLYDYYQRLSWVDDRILNLLHVDTRYFATGTGANYTFKVESDGSFFDEWGCKHVRVGNYGDVAPDGHPLADLTTSELDRYPFPDPEDPSRFAGLKERVKRMYAETQYALIPLNAGSIQWLGTELVGMEKYMVRLITDQKYIVKITDILLDWFKRFFNKLLDEVGEYIELVWLFGDDWGIQTGPIMNPDIFRKIYKYRSKELIDTVKAKTDAKVCIHTCGSVYYAMKDFCEIGIDVVNPVQVAAKDMDTQVLKKEFGKQLSFWGGGCDSQHALPFGTKEEVAAEAKKRIFHLGPGGGYVFASIHNIQAGVPAENIMTMFQTAEKYGKYPLKM